jgi:ABC-type polysaccharide/polyol phosphate export permease
MTKKILRIFSFICTFFFIFSVHKFDDYGSIWSAALIVSYILSGAINLILGFCVGVEVE